MKMVEHNLRQVEQSKNITKTKEYKNGVVHKICGLCQVQKTIFQFPVLSEKKRDREERYYWLANFCRRCKTAKEVNLRNSLPAAKKAECLAIRSAKQRDYRIRTGNRHRAVQMLQVYRNVDSKAGRICDIMPSDIKRLISQPCTYCGRKNIRRGLDRINNDLGHALSNVVSCCGLCNCLRADLPFNIWLEILKVLKKHIIAGDLENMMGGRFSVERCGIPADHFENTYAPHTPIEFPLAA